MGSGCRCLLKRNMLLSKHAIPLMAAGGGGGIINTGSGWGLKGGGRAASYCAAKGGVVNLTRAGHRSWERQHQGKLRLSR